MGIQTDKLIGLEQAASEAGVGQEALFTALRKVPVELDKMNPAFEKLGLNLGELRGLPVDQAFGKIADAFTKVESVTQKNTLAFQLFGEQGQKIVNLLNGGSRNIDETTDVMKKLGFAVDEFDARKIEEMNDALSRTRRQIAPRTAGRSCRCQ